MADGVEPPQEEEEQQQSQDTSLATLISLFDAQCRDYGDHDAVVFQQRASSCAPDAVQPPQQESTIGWSELQYASLALSRQLWFRFERPDFCLVDCGGPTGNAAAELVAVTACIRLGIPFVPVDCCAGQRASGQRASAGLQRLRSIVDTLRRRPKSGLPNHNCSTTNTITPRLRLAAIVVAELGDADPAVAPFVLAGVHQILYLTATGDLLEPMTVPDDDSNHLPETTTTSTTTTIINDNLYILFTSGTSGNTPKAVVGSHRSTLARLQWFQDQFGGGCSNPNSKGQQQSQQPQVIARRTPLTFVDGVNELLAALVTPACRLCCYNNTMNESLPAWIIANSSIHGLKTTTTTRTTTTTTLLTRITLLPSQLEQVLLYLQTHVPSQGTTSSLEFIIVSGEPCPARLVHDFHQCRYFSTSAARLLNFYGQTETTGDCCWVDLTSAALETIIVDGIVPVGRPLPGVTLRLDCDTNEIIVSGTNCLANGYYSGNTTTTTTTTFESDSLATGDVGFYNASNDCWYVRGRMDQVVKINGVLTSPTEVENVLHQVFAAELETALVAAIILDGHVYAVIETTTACGSIDWFSREKMQESGVPYNLIPRQVFPMDQIPRRTGGATKVDLNRLREWMRLRLLVVECDSSMPHDGTVNGDPFVKVVAKVLNVSTWRVVAKEESMSFVELGGDSALAVTLLYQFQAAGLLEVSRRISVTAHDILDSKSVRNLRDLIREKHLENGGGKRMKTADMTRTPSTAPALANFRPDHKLRQVDEQHATVLFAACVDAAPLVHKGHVYGACQGGVVQRIHESAVQCFRLGDHWKVEADLTVMEDVLIVCAYNPENETGHIVALSLDLTTVAWRKTVDGMIKATPVFVNGCVFVHAGNVVHAFDLTFGTESTKMTLPASSESKPIVDDDGRIVYGFSDWDAGLVLLDASSSHFTHIAGVSAPVYADLLRIGDDRVVAADIFGFVHDLNTNTHKLQSHKITTSPIFSSPILIERGKSVVFGSHDGIIRCLSSSDLSSVLWTFNARAVVYARLWEVSMNRGAVVACTTAGKVIVVGDGAEISSYRVDAEIWSGPVGVREDSTNPGTITIAFGARDSKLHFVNVKYSIGVRERARANMQELTLKETNAG